jgi:hypothetical protein
VLFVTVVMALPASCLIYGWRAPGQIGKLTQTDWRLMAPTPGLCFATVSQFLVSGFLIQGFRSDAQSFTEPAPTHWIIFNWLCVLALGCNPADQRRWQRKAATPTVLVEHQHSVGGLDCNYDGLRLLNFRGIGKGYRSRVRIGRHRLRRQLRQVIRSRRVRCRKNSLPFFANFR